MTRLSQVSVVQLENTARLLIMNIHGMRHSSSIVISYCSYLLLYASTRGFHEIVLSFLLLQIHISKGIMNMKTNSFSLEIMKIT